MKIYCIVILCILMISCDTLKGHRGINENIEESKTKQMFVKKYKLLANVNQYPFNNFQDIWLEKDWYHGGFYEKDRIGNAFRLIIHTKESKNYDTTWCVGMKNRDIFEYNRNMIHYFIQEMPKDTINIFLYKKENNNIVDSTKVNLVSTL